MLPRISTGSISDSIADQFGDPRAERRESGCDARDRGFRGLRVLDATAKAGKGRQRMTLPLKGTRFSMEEAHIDDERGWIWVVRLLPI